MIEGDRYHNRWRHRRIGAVRDAGAEGMMKDNEGFLEEALVAPTAPRAMRGLSNNSFPVSSINVIHKRMRIMIGPVTAQ